VPVFQARNLAQLSHLRQYMNTLSLAAKVRIVAALVEGTSIRATERLMGAHRDTVMRLGRDVGEGCARLHDRLFRGLQINVLEVDEIWSFIGKKQGHLKEGDSGELGDSYTYTALDANRKAIVSFVVGRRTDETTAAFCDDLRARILNRPQITSDGFVPYIKAVENAFGADADYAQILKKYAGSTEVVPLARRYSPPRVVSTEKVIITGHPKMEYVSTSYVERSNLSMRMANRRFTRLTNAFSKRARNHEASVALFIAHYNLCRVHETLRVTPAMALGITDHVWSIEELVVAALARPAPEAPVTAAAPAVPTTPTCPSLTVLQGGRR
jgi:IS1 family transposase